MRFLSRPPKAPVTDETRDLIDSAMAWFVETFGEGRLLATQVILPTLDFFPEGWDASEECMGALVTRVCGYMGVGREEIQLDLFRDPGEEMAREMRQQVPHFKGSQDYEGAGYYAGQGDDERYRISLKVSHRNDPIRVIATVAHELAHVLLLGEGRLQRDHPQMEPMTDLATVFCGMGIFNANSAIRYRHVADGTWRGWSVDRLGYTSEEAFGYALAVFANMRGEVKPPWVRHLTVNVAEYFRRSARYLSDRSQCVPSQGPQDRLRPAR